MARAPRQGKAQRWSERKKTPQENKRHVAHTRALSRFFFVSVALCALRRCASDTLYAAFGTRVRGRENYGEKKQNGRGTRNSASQPVSSALPPLWPAALTRRRWSGTLPLISAGCEVKAARIRQRRRRRGEARSESKGQLKLLYFCSVRIKTNTRSSRASKAAVQRSGPCPSQDSAVLSYRKSVSKERGKERERAGTNRKDPSAVQQLSPFFARRG